MHSTTVKNTMKTKGILPLCAVFVFLTACRESQMGASDKGRPRDWPETAPQAACVASPTPECVFEMASDAARRIEVQNPRDHALAQIIESEAETGHIALAEKTLDGIQDRNAKDIALKSIAWAIAKSGDIARALQIAQDITNDSFVRDALYSQIAQTQATSGNLPEAYRTFSLITTEMFRLEASERLTRIFRGTPDPPSAPYAPSPKRGQAEAEALILSEPRLSLALEAANRLSDPFLKGQALSAIAIAYANAGDRQSALKVAMQIEPAYAPSNTRDTTREATIYRIAAIQIEKNDRPAALAIADSLDGNDRSIAMFEIAQEELRIDLFANAIDAARMVLRPDLRATIFKEIARTLSRNLK